MKISLQDLTDKISQGDYIQDLTTLKYADFNKKTVIRQQAEKMVREVAAAFKKNSLAQVQVAVTGRRPVTFSLETNIINLPYSDYKKIANFFEEGKDYPLNVYFETSSDYINVSKFRIDLLASEEELEKASDNVVAKLAQAMSAKLETIRTFVPKAKKKTSGRRSGARSRTKKSSRKKK